MFRTAIIVIITFCSCYFNQCAFSAVKLHDPTKPLGASSQLPSLSQIKIDAIISRAKDPLVFIKGHPYTIGDKILNAEIVAIYQYSVRFKDAQGEFTVAIPNPIIRTTKKKGN